MSLRVTISVTLVSMLGIFINGCAVTEEVTHVAAVQSEPESMAVKPVSNKTTGDPSPKPRPKLEPVYPTAEQVISWHAMKCGGFSQIKSEETVLAEQELKEFFELLCTKGTSAPDEVMKALTKLNLAYFWPDDIKQYFWLQKQQLKQHINARKAQQALDKKMQETMSSLATIEQQLLLREDTKEQ